MTKLRISRVQAVVATTSKSPISRRIALMVSLLLLSSIVTPSASASIQTLSYSCYRMARNVTIDVSPGDVLNFTSDCGSVFLGGYNSNVISPSSGNGLPSPSFVVSASLAPGTYVDAIELYAAFHNFYTLVYTSPVSDAAASAATAKAAAEAAAAKREAEKRDARTEIVRKAIDKQTLSTELFDKAEIPGITAGNLARAEAEIHALPDASRSEINQIMKIARKYEVVGLIGSDRMKCVYPSQYIEIGLISADSKIKSSLVKAVSGLAENQRNTYEEIKAAIEAKTAELQARKDRLAKVLARSSNRNGK
jgi:hypothetical protein